MSVPTTIVADLYKSTTDLAYTESQMAISPRLPFEVKDKSKLNSQANDVANQALRIRGLNPDNLNISEVKAASDAVKGAHALFVLINTNITNTISSGQVFDAVEYAINKLKDV
jgi:hypothetical protein